MGSCSAIYCAIVAEISRRAVGKFAAKAGHRRERESTRPALILVRPPHTRDCNRMSLGESVRVGVNPSTIAYDYFDRGSGRPCQYAGHLAVPLPLRSMRAANPRRRPMVIRSRRMPQGVAHPSVADDHRKRQVHAAETRLLYENATTGIVVTIVIASVVAYAHWDLGPHFIVSAWLIYMLLVSAARFVVVHRYWRASASDDRERSMERGVRCRRRDGGRRLGCRRHPAVPISPAVG